MYTDTFQASLSGDIKSIAEVIYSLYKESYISMSPRKSKWLTFDGIKWCFDENGPQKRFSTDVVVYYQKYSESSGVDTSVVQAKLKHSSYKAAIMKVCQSLFYDVEKLNQLDMVENIVCFRDGVYDVGARAFKTIGNPEWLITIWVDREYDATLPDDYFDYMVQLRNEKVAKRKRFRDQQ